jgi:predicted transcriptional regulator
MKPTIVRTDQKHWTLPGDHLSLDEFKKGIEEAEKGPFYTIEESKKIIAQWRELRNSK